MQEETITRAIIVVQQGMTPSAKQVYLTLQTCMCKCCIRLTKIEHIKNCTCARLLFSLSIYNRIIRIPQHIGKNIVCVVVLLFF